MPEATSAVFEIHATPEVPIGGMDLSFVGSAGSQRASAHVTLDVMAAAPTSHDLINEGLVSGLINYPTSVLYRAYALFDDDRLPEAYRGALGSDVEDSGFFFDASSTELPPEVQAALRPFLLRPADPWSIYQLRAGAAQGLSTTVTGALTEDCTADQPGQTIEGGWKTERITEPVRIWIKCTASKDEDDVLLAKALGLARIRPKSTGGSPTISSDPRNRSIVPTPAGATKRRKCMLHLSLASLPSSRRTSRSSRRPGMP